ncbi:mitogen-activated protein kinase kinase kinase 5 [Actinidia rufa]|uniref:mitogen-activated protein kinase kinase kinase n=1 Tax=Actinidia rufa TaxID=165716 RepID=A0A7J0F5K9_9ERIC|nr:mitogen-activated protein kinase kinase kinase 5 [Actinidia rufa]
MHWWQTPFSSASSSPSSSSKHHSDDSVLTKILLHPQPSGPLAPAPPQPLHQAPLRRRCRRPGLPTPLARAQQPGPIVLKAIAGDSATPASSRIGQPPSRSGEERERDDGLILDADGGGATPGSGFGGKVACHDSRKTKEHANTRPFRKSPKKLNGVERFLDSYVISVPISAPTSTFSSPAMSPQRKCWGYFYVSLYVTSSLVCTGDASFGYESSNGQANVHPLPLPRGATSPSQPTSISQITAKPDLMPIISQWQKGKLIGRGTFGSVYVASNRETGALCAMKEVELCFEDPKSAESIKQLEQNCD